jgi:RHS repeat-associated protein
LVGIGSDTSFFYDGSGNRLKAVRNGVETRYIYDANGNLLAEADANNVITRYYVHGAGLLAAITPAGDLYCYHYDGVGNTVAITDASETVVNSYDYSPFGMILAENETFPQPFKFVGKLGVMAESNGFYYMRARYYDPVVGRFISEDPLGFDGGDVNLYVYAGLNPLLLVDPFGLNVDWEKFARYSNTFRKSYTSKLQKGINAADNWIRNRIVKTVGLPAPVMLSRLGVGGSAVVGAVVYTLRPTELAPSTLDDVGLSSSASTSTSYNIQTATQSYHGQTYSNGK